MIIGRFSVAFSNLLHIYLEFYIKVCFLQDLFKLYYLNIVLNIAPIRIA